MIKLFYSHSSYPGTKPELSRLNWRKSPVHTLCWPHNTQDPGHFNPISREASIGINQVASPWLRPDFNLMSWSYSKY